MAKLTEISTSRPIQRSRDALHVDEWYSRDRSLRWGSLVREEKERIAGKISHSNRTKAIHHRAISFGNIAKWRFMWANAIDRHFAGDLLVHRENRMFSALGIRNESRSLRERCTCAGAKFCPPLVEA